MMLEEANSRLKTVQITDDQLWALNSLYLMLDVEKTDFCKILDVVGIETFLKKQSHYDRLRSAEEQLTAKEKYLKAKQRLEDLENEKGHLEAIVNGYKPY